ncbi:SPFH domain / Band 7 family protein [uncultured archaeon]|nr:SPFH domain / Band 7 family protein [uncultured archaeon]
MGLFGKKADEPQIEEAKPANKEMGVFGKLAAAPLSIIGLAKVVPVDEAHVVVGVFGGRTEYSSRTENIVGETVEVAEKDGKTTHKVNYKTETRVPNPVYFRFPGITKIQKIPLGNLRIDVENTKLNDKDMAKFVADTICFVRVSNAVVAAERTNLNAEKMKFEKGPVRISDDFQAILASIARTVATQQTIVDIFKDRKGTQTAIATQLADVAPQWGITLVDLELKDIRDDKGSTIIADIERKQAAVIKANADVVTAEEDRRARVVQAEQGKAAKIAEAEAAEISGTREIEKDKKIAIAKQKQAQDIADETAIANAKGVEAKRKKDVGEADVQREVKITNAEAEKQKTIKEAEAEREKISIEAEGTKTKLQKEAEGEASKITQTGIAQAEITQKKGEAEGVAILAKKKADAEGTKLLADAQKLYNEGGLPPKIVDAITQIELARANAGAQIAEHAHISVITGNTQELLNGGILGNVGVGPKEGAALGQFAEMLGLTGSDVNKLLRSVGKPEELTKALTEVGRDVVARKTETETAAPAATKTPVAASGPVADTNLLKILQ